MNAYDINTLEKKAGELFAPKTFAVKFLTVFKVSKWISPALSAFSVVTGFGCLYYIMMPSLGVILGGLVALMILLTIEGAKRLFGTPSFVDMYSDNGTSVPMLLIMLCFFAASIYLSVVGAGELVNHTTTRISNIVASYKASVDSIEDRYQAAKAFEMQRHDAFIQSVTWMGKIDSSNKGVRATIERHNNTLANLERERLENVEILRNYKESSTLTATQRTNFDVVAWTVISGINELLIMLCIWFRVYYLYMVDYTKKASEFGVDMRIINKETTPKGIIQGLLDDMKSGETRFNVLAAKHKVNARIISEHRKLLV